jgi:hypothetical protein
VNIYKPEPDDIVILETAEYKLVERIDNDSATPSVYRIQVFKPPPLRPITCNYCGKKEVRAMATNCSSCGANSL